MNAFKSQQHRWAKGSIQTCKKLLPRDPGLRAAAAAIKVEAAFHLTANFAYPLMIAALAAHVPGHGASATTWAGTR